MNNLCRSDPRFITDPYIIGLIIIVFQNVRDKFLPNELHGVVFQQHGTDMRNKFYFCKLAETLGQRTVVE
jgi:hypothetical protein